MKKFLLVAAALLVAIASPAIAGGGNVLASGEIALAASATPSTNTASVGIYGSGINAGKEWAQVYALAIKNNSDFTVTAVVSRVDLGLSTALITAVATSKLTVGKTEAEGWSWQKRLYPAAAADRSVKA